MTRQRGQITTISRLRALAAHKGGLIYLTSGGQGSGNPAYIYTARLVTIDDVPAERWYKPDEAEDCNLTLGMMLVRHAKITEESHQLSAGSVGIQNHASGMALWSLRQYAEQYVGVKENV